MPAAGFMNAHSDPSRMTPRPKASKPKKSEAAKRNSQQATASPSYHASMASCDSASIRSTSTFSSFGKEPHWSDKPERTLLKTMFSVRRPLRARSKFL